MQKFTHSIVYFLPNMMKGMPIFRILNGKRVAPNNRPTLAKMPNPTAVAEATPNQGLERTPSTIRRLDMTNNPVSRNEIVVKGMTFQTLSFDSSGIEATEKKCNLTNSR